MDFELIIGLNCTHTQTATTSKSSAIAYSHTVQLVCCVFTGCLVTASNAVASSASVLSGFCPRLLSVSQFDSTLLRNDLHQEATFCDDLGRVCLPAANRRLLDSLDFSRPTVNAGFRLFENHDQELCSLLDIYMLRNRGLLSDEGGLSLSM
jgi:hypothetical protein